MRAGEVREALTVDKCFFFLIWNWHREGLGWGWHDRAKHPCRLSEATEASGIRIRRAGAAIASSRSFAESSSYPKRLPPRPRLT